MFTLPLSLWDEEGTCRRKMKRFIIEEAGPDSWKIRMIKTNYHYEEEYGTLSFLSLSRGRRSIFMIEKARFQMGLGNEDDEDDYIN